MQKQWRSLEQLDESPSSKAFLEREFQEGASVLEEGVSRRTFLKFLGGTTALAGLSGCVSSIRKPYKKIYPYAKKIEHAVPGKPLFYASSFVVNDVVTGVLVETYEGRPTKLEGNPGHGLSRGSSSVFEQAAILNLYDPDRLTQPLYLTKKSSLDAFKDFMRSKRRQWSKNQGQGLRVLCEDTVSPLQQELLSTMLTTYPKSKVYRYSSVNSENAVQALSELTSVQAKPFYHLDKSAVIVSFADDFLGVQGHQTHYTKDFSSRRDPDSKNLNRLYTFEDRLSMTGSKSDHRYPVKQSDLLQVASCLLVHVAKLVKYDLSNLGFSVSDQIKLDYVDTKVIKEIAKDLYENRGKSLIAVGPQLSKDVHKIALILNHLLYNNFATVTYHGLPEGKWNAENSLQSLKQLVAELNQDKVDSLIILANDPVYSSPSDLQLEKAITKAADRIHLVDIENQSSRLCDWVLPKSHFLESWGDAQSINGQVSLVQPVIHKMYESMNEVELINLCLQSYVSDYSLLRKYWRNRRSESAWKKALHDGVLLSRSTEKRFTISSKSLNVKVKPVSKSLELTFFTDYTVFDGRFSNNPWLQELSDPIHKLTWDNAAFISPKTAKSLSLKTGDIVSIQVGQASITIPVFISPGQAHQSISIPIGYGQSVDGKVGKDVGVSVKPIRRSDAFHLVESVVLIKQKGKHEFASTQDHGQMEGRPHFRYTDLSDYKKHPNFANEAVHVPLDRSLWDDHRYDEGYQWGMVIDLNKCTSCNTCITSCQSENNIPVVGKEEIKNGREMSWMRVDRYYEGDQDNPDMVSQPVTCLHCENAPCEQVCPVAATVHDTEGLNVMVYNRCVGTRYCSDNCPVKVRRFNFFDYHQRSPHAVDKERFHFFDYMKEPNETYKKQFNPDVTVRMRGVMEKCTFCIQRIKSATQQAKNEDRTIVDGEVVSACQQACPADAIVMGDINDPNSKVSKLRSLKRNYSILEQLLLRARTTYLAAVYNPNPNLVEKSKHKSEASHVHH